MKKKFYLSIVFMLSAFAWSQAQELPEYINYATAWNSTTNTSTPLAQEEGESKTKVGAQVFLPTAPLAKHKLVMKFSGLKSVSRIKAEDTLKIFVKIDKETNPEGLFKIYKAKVKSSIREVLYGTFNVNSGTNRLDGDFSYTIKKISPGVFRLSVVGPKSGDELFLFLSSHDSNEKFLAKLSLGID